MRSFFGLITLCSGLIAWGLISLHHWLAYAAAGIVIGVGMALFWFLGSIQQTVEYWSGAGPRWMPFLFGNPKITEEKFHAFSKHYKCNAGKWLKIESILLGLLVAVLLRYLGIRDRTYSYAAMMFPITWVLCVCLSEIYFRTMYYVHKFNRIREDSDI